MSDEQQDILSAGFHKRSNSCEIRNVRRVTNWDLVRYPRPVVRVCCDMSEAGPCDAVGWGDTGIVDG